MIGPQQTPNYSGPAGGEHPAPPMCGGGITPLRHSGTEPPLTRPRVESGLAVTPPFMVAMGPTCEGEAPEPRLSERAGGRPPEATSTLKPILFYNASSNGLISERKGDMKEDRSANSDSWTESGMSLADGTSPESNEKIKGNGAIKGIRQGEDSEPPTYTTHTVHIIPHHSLRHKIALVRPEPGAEARKPEGRLARRTNRPNLGKGRGEGNEDRPKGKGIDYDTVQNRIAEHWWYYLLRPPHVARTFVRRGEWSTNAQTGQHDLPRSSDPPQSTGNQTKYQRQVRVWPPEEGEHGEPRARAPRARTLHPPSRKESTSPRPRPQQPKERHGWDNGKDLEQQYFLHIGRTSGAHKIFPLYHEYGMNGWVTFDKDNAGSGSPPPMY